MFRLSVNCACVLWCFCICFLSATILITGPPLLTNGIPTAFTVKPSAWSSLWPALNLQWEVSPVGAVTTTSMTWPVSFSSSSSLRSDNINITISLKFVNPSGFLSPPPPLVLFNVGSGINTLVGGQICMSNTRTDGSTFRVGGPFGNMAVSFQNPQTMVYSPVNRTFLINSGTLIRQFTPATRSVATFLGSTTAATYLTAAGVGTGMMFNG